MVDLRPTPRLVVGAGAIGRLGELVGGLGARRAFVVTDSGIAAAGHVERALDSLRAAGLEARVHDRVRENPDSEDVAACREALGDFPADALVGLGGGSSIDVAKGCAFVLAGGGRMEDYRGYGKARGALPPLVAVPTTAGTGSEMQSFALIAEPRTHAKMACGDPRAAPRIAVLDPELTVTQPERVTLCTGLDALGHALETAVTTARNEVSSAFSHRAFAMARSALPRVLEEPGDLQARRSMQMAAALAGAAIEASMLGIAHSLANPLTARHGLPHGLAVGLMLPHVVRWNAGEPAAAATYRELAVDAGLCGPGRDGAEAIARRIEDLLDGAGVARSLRAHGVGEEDVPGLAAEAAAQWTARFNPRPAGAEELAHVLRLAL